MIRVPPLMLRVDGADYSGWQTVKVKTGVSCKSGEFELQVSELWSGQRTRREIPPGAQCQLLIDSTPVITGYVDDSEPNYSADDLELAVRGRDAAGDLVDCAAIHATGQWRNQKLDAIARDICKPFGIAVRVETDTGAPFLSWQIESGERAADCLERMARHRGVLIASDYNGGIRILRPSTQRVGTPLVLGQNIKRASGTNSMRDRFSEYIVLGQSELSDTEEPEVSTALKASVKDLAVTRYRPSIALSDAALNGGALKDLATWLRNVAAGRSLQVTYTVVGWEHADGLWMPDRMVPVVDSFLRIERDLYISDVEFSLSNEEAITQITVTLPEAYSLLALPEPAEEGVY